MEFRRHKLDNGLEIVAECNDQAHSSGLAFFVRTGARDETSEVAGVSHFLEHMVFKGTPKRSAEDVNREFDEMGAHYNAFTSEENTVYYAAVLPECQERCVDLLADIMRPSLREDDFNTEKQVIIEEIKMYDDQPPFGADDKCKLAHFGTHPLSNSVLGTEESVSQLTAQQMKTYFQSRYSPGNMLLAGAGKIDFDALVKQAEQLCGGWEKSEAPRALPAVESSSGVQVICHESAAQEYVLQMLNGPTATDEDRFAAKLLAMIIGDDSGSRLYWELVDPGRAEHASLGHYEYDGAGVFMSYMSCDPEMAAANYDRMLGVFREAESGGISAEELLQAKSKLSSRVVLGSERPRSRLFSVGGNWMQRQEYRAVKDDLDAVTRVTLEEVHAVLEKYPLSVNTTVAIGPLAELG